MTAKLGAPEADQENIAPWKTSLGAYPGGALNCAVRTSTSLSKGEEVVPVIALFLILPHVCMGVLTPVKSTLGNECAQCSGLYVLSWSLNQLRRASHLPPGHTSSVWFRVIKTRAV